VTDDAAAPPARTRVADAVSLVSDFGAAWVAVAVLQVASGKARPSDVARRLAAAGAVSLVLTRWLKHRYRVPRDASGSSASLARTPSSDRFPSGHTLAAFVAARVLPRTPAGRALAVAFAAVVAWARVRVGHHEAVDVVAGAAVGSLAGATLARVLPSV
jgi:membrane-associated phospholipid phosphatase